MEGFPHRRLLFVLALAGLIGAVPLQEQSSAQQSPALSTPRPKPDARKAKQAYERGLRAEQAGNWPAAFEAYSQAANHAPAEPEVLLRRETARFQMVQQHTDRAEREALAGRPDRAREELRAALQIDPSYSVARERLAQLEVSVPPPPEQAPSFAESPAEIQPQPGTRDFDHRGDVRGAYEAVARAFGLAASFDTDLPARSIRFRVHGVDFQTAMALLGQQTGTFWRALDAHTFFVTENTAAKRSQYAPVVVRTFTLPSSATPDRMTETMRLVREIVGVTHTELDTRSRTLTLRDSPETVALAGALIREIEQAPGELMLEIEILEVDQNVARRLGVTPPSTLARVLTLSTQDIRQAQQSTQGLLEVIRRLFGLPTTLAGLNPAQGPTVTGAGPLNLGTLVPPLVTFGGGQTRFFATLPGAAADFSEIFSLIRSGRRVLLRAQDAQPATFFVGERFPVALAVLGASFVPGQSVSGANQPIFPRTDFPTGAAPVRVATADFNGDARLDLAVVNKGANTVSILLGNGDGTFGAKTDFPTGTSPVAIATGDFNGDGKFDLAVVNQGDNSVSILLGNGDGTFGAKTDFPAGTSPVAIATGDFNGDGKLDLAVVNQNGNTTSILLGKGDGTFSAKTDFATGIKPSAITTGDFNGDTRPDLAVANQGGNTVSILLGNGDGTFSPKIDFAVGTSPVAVATGDFNADAKTDLAVANQGSNTVSILLGKGDGTFNLRNDFATGSSPAAIITGDFNVDGNFDVAVANQASNTISILLGNGTGGFNFRLDLVAGTGPVGMAKGDFNADGRLDLALADQTANTVSVILNSGVPFLAAQNIPQTPYPGAEYEDLGLKVRATPRIHADDEVTLQLGFEIRSLAGVAVNGIPVISNRTIQQTVRLRKNETAVLSGIIQQEETRAITGLPGFAHAAGHLAGRRDTQKHATELLFLITPRQLRLAPRTDRSIYAGRGTLAPAAERPQIQQ
jgi:tetratricopeptide (TPR) repeat protein